MRRRAVSVMVLPIALVDDDTRFPRRDVRQPRPACFSIFHDMTSLILMAQIFPQCPVRPHVYFCDVDKSPLLLIYHRQDDNVVLVDDKES